MCKLSQCIQCGKTINHDQLNGRCDTCNERVRRQDAERNKIRRYQDSKKNKKKKAKVIELDLERLADTIEE